MRAAPYGVSAMAAAPPGVGAWVLGGEGAPLAGAPSAIPLAAVLLLDVAQVPLVLAQGAEAE